MTVRGEALLAELGSLPAHVRADYVRVLDTVAHVALRGWTRRRGVRLLWLTLRDGDDPVVARRDSGELSEHVDWDGPRSARSFAGALRKKLGTNRCAALVHGNAIDSRTWGWVIPLLVGQLPRLDTAVMVDIEHRDGNRSTFAFPIRYRRLLVRRPRFEEDLRTILRRAGTT
ncbi:hypothetical protein ACIQVT_12925 [Streptomyces sp. NPDC100445]|uniref:hypothetical protein n=1 Tax=Streptomyces sp. NPDC100445 TaxID=3366102 RepID=UPI0038183245